ncbi:MAG: PQQ-dependent sugar dehydrogenase [Ignavibacteriales bacterium]|nr:PQQ-dependent sugar dehydrogenase [Ignavibacteriales bacterium]
MRIFLINLIQSLLIERLFGLKIIDVIVLLKNTKYDKYILILSFLLVVLQNNIISQVIIKSAFPNLGFNYPVDIQNSNDGSNRVFVVSQDGVIHVFNNSENISKSKVFLDIRDKVLFGGEQGLLGLAFHPEYYSNGYFYINYTKSNPRRTVISRFTVSIQNPDSADISSEIILLEIEQPYSNHNGGQLAFGNDGFLYISLGDGGSGGDPENRAQNLSVLLGKILRIDVDISEGNQNYTIPNDNPFKDNSEGKAEEIFAYGLRNVWRFSFDSSGKLWAADVGQNQIEEINIIENGGNYGWRIMEGTQCYNPSTNCNTAGLSLPILEYFHNSSGGYSITGGYVYQGNSAPSLNGKYIYGDFVSGNIWSYDEIDDKNEFIVKYDGQVSTFGIDENNELFFADYESGKILKFSEGNINSVKSEIDQKVYLLQNYPNPFNPSTIISYNLDEEANVIIDVYNSIGEKVTTLVNENQLRGFYQIEFNINDSSKKISGGIYFYRLRANNYIQTSKMILLN